MSARDYEVALIRVLPEMEPEVGVRGAGIFDAKWYVGGPRRGSQHGFHDVEVIRPLVVIDPEQTDLYIQSDGHDMTVWHDDKPLLTEHQAGPVLWAHLVATLPTRDEPQPEPLDPGVRVTDGEGDEWARIATFWVDQHGDRSVVWRDLVEQYGPVEIVTPAPEPTPDERPFKVGTRVDVRRSAHLVSRGRVVSVDSAPADLLPLNDDERVIRLNTLTPQFVVAHISMLSKAATPC